MSMPLAIIGNEYASAWESLQKQVRHRAMESAADDSAAMDVLALRTQTVPPDIARNLRASGRGDETRGRSDSTDHGAAEVTTGSTPLLDCRKNLDQSLVHLRNLTATARKMNPATLLAVCELRGWIAPLLWNVRTAVVELAGEDVQKDSRRVSFMRSSVHAVSPNVPWEEQLKAMQMNYDGVEGITANDLAMSAVGTATQGRMKFETDLPRLDEGDSSGEEQWSEEHHRIAISTSRHSRTHAQTASDETQAPAAMDDSSNRPPGSNSGPMRESFWPFLPLKSLIGRASRIVSSIAPEPEGPGCPESTQVEMGARGSGKVQPLTHCDEKRDASLDGSPCCQDAPRVSTLDEDGTTPGSNGTLPPTPTSPRLPKKRFSKLSSAEFTSSITKAVLHRDQSSTFIVKIAKAAPDIAGMRGDGAEFARNMERAVRNPKSIRTKIWMIMEFPHSSKGARLLQYFLLFLIMLSVLMLYTQTLPTFSDYGEGSLLCGKVLQRYCDGKNDMSLDPGCYVYDENGPTSQKLKFGCQRSDCFGKGLNYGSSYTNSTCKNADRPFQTQDELIVNYRAPDFVVSRDTMHEIQDVCLRIECNYNAKQIVDGNSGWFPVETFINISFTIEIFLRIFVSSSVYGFLADFMNIFDILSVVPFYVDVAESLSRGHLDMNFAIIASSPEPILLVALKSMKVFRLFKMTRHFSASQVLVTTANKAWRQIVGILSLLFFIVAVFSLLLYEVEKGNSCYVGHPDCHVPDDVATTVQPGELIFINKVGGISKFGNVLDSLWFSIVTLTSVGYGDIVPTTNLGQFMTVFLMLFGAMYLSMPLTVAATTFWDVHQSYLEKQKKKKANASRKIMDAVFIKRMRSLEVALLVVSKKLDTFFKDIQEPTEGESRLTFLDRCKDIESTLTKTLAHHDPDLRRLSAAYSTYRHRSSSYASDFGNDSQYNSY